MKSPEKEAHPTAFWPRLAAIWIDTLVVCGFTYLGVITARLFAIYVPFELVAVVLAVVYSALLLGWKGQTVGKWVCGLVVQGKNGTPIGYRSAFLREFVGKLLMGLGVPIGLTWLLARPTGPGNDGAGRVLLIPLIFVIGYLVHLLWIKRTWYDHLAHTVVGRDHQPPRGAPVVLALVLSVSGIAIVLKAAEVASDDNTYREASPYSLAPTPYDDRAPAALREVSSITTGEDSTFVQWLAAHGKNPVDYSVDVASQHQVTIFGETHENRGQVSFLHKIIPALYHRAGVRCLAMEVCTREDNEDINRLITAPVYDPDLALRIGRHSPWQTWGFKEYWGTFETVWQLNRDLADGQQKMRIVGIDRQWDGPSIALVFSSGIDGVKAPFWEKLRVFRALATLPTSLAFRDELMAREVEKEIIERGERGIVWVGGHHAFTHYKQPYGKGRMAYILHQKYGDKVFQVSLQALDISPTFSFKFPKPGYQGPEPTINEFIERIMAVRGQTPVGFDIAGSPFATLRDSTSYYYHSQSSVDLADFTSGYIYLEPTAAFQKCQWAEGYITSEMYARNKPFGSTSFSVGGFGLTSGVRDE
ncbi:MAG: RDD family protein [Candidatus Latescibacteria bacterium]|nr:RDD family protein [Candidatus Latescibacterota bacterium]